MPDNEEHTLLCQCDRCMASFEVSGTVQDGTLKLYPDRRISISRGELVDTCGGRLQFFAYRSGQAKLPVSYPKQKRGRGRPKKSSHI